MTVSSILRNETQPLFHPGRLAGGAALSARRRLAWFVSVFTMKFPPRACPACGHRFVPWNLWRITRWSCLSCPSCTTKLTRNLFALQLLAALGLTFAVVFGSGLGALLWIKRSRDVALWIERSTYVPVTAFVVIAVVGLLLGYLLDVATVRLAVAHWRGWLLGYTSKSQPHDT